MVTAMPARQHLHRLSKVWVEHPVYFLTVCTANRRKLLDQPPVAEILLSSWRSAPEYYGWAIGRYVVMPDHVHFFGAPQLEARSLSAFMRDWKKWTTRQMTEQGLATAPVWQPEFFDHVLRSPGSYVEKWAYVRENPVRAGLAAAAEAWPYAGECAVFRF